MPSLGALVALVAVVTLFLNAHGAPLNQSGITAKTASYSLIADYSGLGFSDHFIAFTGPDPTHGDVVYVDMETAQASKLITYKNTSGTSHAIIGVDHTNLAPSGRGSVRLTSKQTFSVNTLSVLDVRHIPVQWGVWPAVWFLGDLPGGTWPGSNGGESDWLEWVHKSPYNSMTLHTGPNCVVSSSSSSFQGTLLNTNCNAGSGSDGCSIAAFAGDSPSPSRSPITPYTNSSSSSSSSSSSFAFSQAPTAGDAFNSARGAIYAHLWTPQGVTVWMFPHGSVPSDLEDPQGSPDPESWYAHTSPLARFQGTGCDFTQALQEMRLIINIDFCGDWAGKAEVWASSGAQAATGVGSCAEFVAAEPEAFAEVYFEVAGLRFYGLDAASSGVGARMMVGKGARGTIMEVNGMGGLEIFENRTTGGLANSTFAGRWAKNLAQPTGGAQDFNRPAAPTSRWLPATVILLLIVGLSVVGGIGFWAWACIKSRRGS